MHSGRVAALAARTHAKSDIPGIHSSTSDNVYSHRMTYILLQLQSHSEGIRLFPLDNHVLFPLSILNRTTVKLTPECIGVLSIVHCLTIQRCTCVSRYTPHGAVHDTQHLYRGTLRYAIAVGKTIFASPL